VFLGEFEHALDDRGRIAVPAKFRGELHEGLVLTRGIERCLFAWPMDEWKSITDKLGQLSVMQADARRIYRFLFSSATDCSLDRLGRVLVPGFLREYAELRDSVMIVGLMNRIEIWSRGNWLLERDQAEQRSAEIAEHLSSLGV